MTDQPPTQPPWGAVPGGSPDPSSPWGPSSDPVAALPPLPPAHLDPSAPSAAAPATSGAGGGGLPPVSEPTTPSGSDAGPGDGSRPVPTFGSLAGAVAGLLLVAGLLELLGELGGKHVRLGGIVISALFQVLGAGLLWMNRGQRSATAGVVLFGIGLLPFLGFLLVDVDHPSHTVNSVKTFTGTTTAILATAGIIWLGVYLVGPGRRFGLFLGAALVAFWLIAVVQIVDRPLNQIAGGFENITVGSSSFDPGGSTTFDDGTGNGTFGFDENGNPIDENGDPIDPFGSSSSDPFGTSSNDPFEGTLAHPDNPSTKLGIASTLFGAAYLALAARSDRRRNARQATVFFAAAAPILTIGIAFLSGDLHTIGTSLAALAIGAVAVWLAAPHGRRFTSWYGTLAIALAVLLLVDEWFGRSPRVVGVLLTLLGLAIAVVAGRLERGESVPGRRGPAAGGPVPAGVGVGGPLHPGWGDGTPFPHDPDAPVPVGPSSVPVPTFTAPDPSPWQAPGWATPPSGTTFDPTAPAAPADPEGPGESTI